MLDSKFNQWMFAIAMGFVALACYWGKKNSAPEALRVDQDFSYEMPRQKSVSADFDLSGRSIVRKTETVKTTTYNNNRGPLPSPAVPTTAPAANASRAKGEQAAKRAEEQKKKKIADAKKAEEARRSRASVNIAKAADGQDQPMARLADNSNSSGGAGGYGGAAYAPQTQDQTATANSDPNSNIPKYTASQWQALLTSQPTAANAAQLLAAYKAKMVDSTTFYQIVQSLVTDPSKDKAALGVALLQQTPSLKSFSILVDSSSQIQDPTLKASATKLISAYGAPSQFSILAQALYSTDAQVLSTATELISMALSTEGTQSQGGSSGSAASPQQFQVFVPGLTKLASSSDPNVASQAQALLSGIQALHV